VISRWSWAACRRLAFDTRHNTPIPIKERNLISAKGRNPQNATDHPINSAEINSWKLVDDVPK
jgi:hypothetical protein